MGVAWRSSKMCPSIVRGLGNLQSSVPVKDSGRLGYFGLRHRTSGRGVEGADRDSRADSRVSLHE